MIKRLPYFFILLLIDCSSKDKYDISRYYDVRDQNRVLTGIVTYIFDAPPLTKMKDRFLPKHYNYYSYASNRFSIEKFFIAKDGTHFFYVIRPAPNPKERRGVGGYFKMNDNFEINHFREVFVTPILPEADVKGRCSFLFDEMVKGNIEKYFPMETYIQWPNPISQYDTITYEWKLRPEYE